MNITNDFHHGTHWSFVLASQLCCIVKHDLYLGEPKSPIIFYQNDGEIGVQTLNILSSMPSETAIIVDG